MNELALARDAVAGSHHPVVFSGAGLSADSGLPTFRDQGEGFWERHDPHELASVEGFRKDPELVLSWYAMRRRLYAEVEPNPAHLAIASSGVLNITQNVDGLLKRAGVDAARIAHLHGRINHDRCHSGCGHLREVDMKNATQDLGRCPDCGDAMRPDVVWFGEGLPSSQWTRATRWCEEADCLLVVGTSAVVEPAAGLVGFARRNGAVIIDVNPHRVGVEELVDIKVRMGAAEAIPAILGMDAADPSLK